MGHLEFLEILVQYIFIFIYATSLHQLNQGWPRRRPRAIFGPPRLFNGPWKHFQNIIAIVFLFNSYKSIIFCWILARQVVFDQDVGPLSFFVLDFGPFVKKVGHP
jgi:hypothetical protein